MAEPEKKESPLKLLLNSASKLLYMLAMIMVAIMTTICGFFFNTLKGMGPLGAVLGVIVAIIAFIIAIIISPFLCGVFVILALPLFALWPMLSRNQKKN